jgi:hypothetical protein
MGLMEIFFDGGLAFYIVAGSTSLGYIFLRLGWPDIRKLDKQYKAGWSIIIGLVFSAIVVIASLTFSLLPFFSIGFREALLLNLAVTFIAATLLLTFKRKFIVRNKMTVSMPSTLLGAKVTAKKVVEQLESEPGFIRASKIEGGKIDELKKRLGRDEGQDMFASPDNSRVMKAPEISQAAPKPGKFAVQQKNVVAEIPKAQEKQPESKPADKILPAEKSAQAESPLQIEKKPQPETQVQKQQQLEQQAKKLDKVEELRKMLDERLGKSTQEKPQKFAAEKTPESKPPGIKPSVGPLEQLKKIAQIAPAKSAEEKLAIGWLPTQQSASEKQKPSTQIAVVKQQPSTLQKTQTIADAKPKFETATKEWPKKQEEEKPKPAAKPATLEEEDKGNVLEKLLEEKRKEIEKLKKIRKGQ